MKIAIVGIGGVGGYIGGKLIKSNNDNKIIFIARGKQLKAIKKNGLKILDEDEQFIVKPDIITDNPENEGIFDLVIIAVKSYNLENAIKNLKSNISKQTVIIPLLNGVDHDKKIKEFFPEAIVLNGCIYIFSNIKEYGIIKKYGNIFNLMFGSNKYPIENFNYIKQLFDHANLKNKLTSKIDFEVWRKYLLISAYASLTSFYKQPIGFIAKYHLSELKTILNEIKEIANKKGIQLNEKNCEQIIQRIQNVPYESKTSMQLDYEKDKKTELESLCGYIVKEGEKLSIKTPLMGKIYKELK